MGKNIKITVEKRPLDSSLYELESEWEALLKRSSCPSIYSTLDYIYVSCKHCRLTEDIFFLLFRKEGTNELLSIFPLSIWDDSRYGIPLKIVEHGLTTKTSDVDKPYPMIDRQHEEACWKRFRTYFQKDFRAWDVLIYDEVSSDFFLTRAVRKIFTLPFFWTQTRPGPDSPMVRLDGEWNVFWKAHSNLRKSTRRLEKKIGASFSYNVTGAPEDVERCLNEYIATEMASWKAGEAVSHPATQKLYHELLPKLAAKNQVFFGMMYDGDTVISAEISYVLKDRVYFAHGTYNPAYSKLSPGSVSTGHFIKFFYGKGYVEGDFLAGYAHYINGWASRIEKTNNIIIRRMGWRNWFFAMRHMEKKLKLKFKGVRREHDKS